jgi:hypothetical protein
LYVIAAYLAFFGVLFVFVPGVFEQITQSTLLDAKLTLLYGQYILTFAFVAFMAAREKGGSQQTVAYDSDRHGWECGYFWISAHNREGRLSSSWPAPDRQFCIDSSSVSFQKVEGLPCGGQPDPFVNPHIPTTVPKASENTSSSAVSRNVP